MELIILAVAVVALLVAELAGRQPGARHTARANQLELAAADTVETFTEHGCAWVLYRDATRVRVVSLVTVREEQAV